MEEMFSGGQRLPQADEEKLQMALGESVEALIGKITDVQSTEGGLIACALIVKFEMKPDTIPYTAIASFPSDQEVAFTLVEQVYDLAQQVRADKNGA